MKGATSESKLMSFDRIRSNFSVTLPERFSAAIALSSPLDLPGKQARKRESFHLFSSGEVLAELLELMLLLDFLFGVINNEYDSIRLNPIKHLSLLPHLFNLVSWKEDKRNELFL